MFKLEEVVPCIEGRVSCSKVRFKTCCRVRRDISTSDVFAKFLAQESTSRVAFNFYDSQVPHIAPSKPFSIPHVDSYVYDVVSDSLEYVSALTNGISTPVGESGLASAFTPTEVPSTPIEGVSTLASTFVPPLVKPSRRPSFKGQKVISTKAASQVHFVSIDGVSFHSEDSIHEWKFVVHRVLLARVVLHWCEMLLGLHYAIGSKDCSLRFGSRISGISGEYS
ncbi:flocculation protein FLO11-like [Cucumis melo var. makuwa]|uniref:Flocculation protein FLO11-like n=1 Tax=Cucumis melo var. makuwa TaxID=1194695 RepID=A0A5A7VAI8_CUCMM|nr:flocculation protein FLO11-like [Cucumis melo var. makuwa]